MCLLAKRSTDVREFERSAIAPDVFASGHAAILETCAAANVVAFPARTTKHRGVVATGLWAVNLSAARVGRSVGKELG